MDDQNRDADLSRRNLGAFLGALGGAMGLAALSACSGDEPPSVEPLGQGQQPWTTADGGVTGSNFKWVDTIRGVGMAHSGTTLYSMAAGSDLTSTSAPVVIVGGYWKPGDGGGGLFYWSNASITDDGGTKIVPLASGGDGGVGSVGPGWIRIYSGPLNVRWFGAQGSGTNDTSAIQRTFAAKESLGGGSVYIPTGSYVITASIDIGLSPCIVFGDGCSCYANSTFKGGGYTNPGVALGSALLYEGSGSALVFGASNPNSVINGLELRDLIIVGNSQNGTTGIDLSQHAAGMICMKISHVFIAGFAVGMYVGASGNSVQDCAFRDLHIRGCQVGIELNGSINCQWFSTNIETCDTAILAISATNHVFYGGLIQSNAMGVYLNANGNDARLVLLSFDGFYYENNTDYAIHFDNSMNSGNSTIQYCRFTNSYFATSPNNTTVDSIQFTGSLQATLPLYPSQANGICFDGLFSGRDLSIPDWFNYTYVVSCFFAESIKNNGYLTTVVAPGNFVSGLSTENVPALQIGPNPNATANPPSGFVLYVDPADGKLKAKSPSGSVTILAS